MRYAVINTNTGLVENVIELDEGGDWSAPEGCEIVESDVAGPGWAYSAGKFTAPVVPKASK
jgi:hypothetical protein